MTAEASTVSREFKDKLLKSRFEYALMYGLRNYIQMWICPQYVSWEMFLKIGAMVRSRCSIITSFTSAFSVTMISKRLGAISLAEL